MWERAIRKRDELADTLWLVPSLCTVLAVILAFVLVRVDETVKLSDRATSTPWLYGGGAEGARGVLTSIASTMITVAGTVFSITILTLQLASSQFTPRVLRHFTGDRGVQLVLGVFIGNFTYCLLVLRSIHSRIDEQRLFVPVISVSVAVLLALVAIGMLIYQIHHVARSIQAAVIVDRAAKETVDAFDRLGKGFDQVGEDGRSIVLGATGWPFREDVGGSVAADSGGYVLTVDVDRLLGWAAERSASIRVLPTLGAFVITGEPMLLVVADERLSDDDLVKLRGAVLLGVERTMRGDPAFGIRQLSDIALKALSPGINDPTTAQTCIDRLGEILVRAAKSGNLGERTHLGGGGRVHLAGIGFDELVEVAYAQVRHYGAADAIVMSNLVRTLGTVAALVGPVHGQPLVRQARLAIESAREKITVSADVEQIEGAGAWALRSVGTP